MKKFLPLLLLALGLVCAFTACSGPEFITAGLKIEITGIERAGDGTVRVSWRVQNPNVFAYLLDRTVHKLSLNGTVVGTFAETSRLGVPAQNHADSTSVLNTAKSGGSAAIDQAVAQGSADYRLDSTITVLLLDDKTEKIPFSGSGKVTVTAK